MDDLDNATRLLDQGVDANTEVGGSPLLWAAILGPRRDARMVKLLVAHGADPKRIFKGTTAIDLARGASPEILRAVAPVGSP